MKSSQTWRSSDKGTCTDSSILLQTSCVFVYLPEWSQGVHTPHEHQGAIPGHASCIHSSPTAGLPRQHIFPGTAAPGNQCGNPNHCLFLHMAFLFFFHLFELSVQEKSTDYKALQWKSIPKLRLSLSALPYLLLPIARPEHNHIKNQNPKPGQGQKPLKLLQWSWAKYSLLFCTIALLCHSPVARNDAAASLRNLSLTENCEIAKFFLF